MSVRPMTSLENRLWQVGVFYVARHFHTCGSYCVRASQIFDDLSTETQLALLWHVTQGLTSERRSQSNVYFDATVATVFAVLYDRILDEIARQDYPAFFPSPHTRTEQRLLDELLCDSHSELPLAARSAGGDDVRFRSLLHATFVEGDTTCSQEVDGCDRAVWLEIVNTVRHRLVHRHDWPLLVKQDDDDETYEAARRALKLRRAYFQMPPGLRASGSRGGRLRDSCQLAAIDELDAFLFNALKQHIIMGETETARESEDESNGEEEDERAHVDDGDKNEEGRLWDSTPQFSDPLGGGHVLPATDGGDKMAWEFEGGPDDDADEVNECDVTKETELTANDGDSLHVEQECATEAKVQMEAAHIAIPPVDEIVVSKATMRRWSEWGVLQTPARTPHDRSSTPTTLSVLGRSPLARSLPDAVCPGSPQVGLYDPLECALVPTASPPPPTSPTTTSSSTTTSTATSVPTLSTSFAPPMTPIPARTYSKKRRTLFASQRHSDHAWSQARPHQSSSLQWEFDEL